MFATALGQRGWPGARTVLQFSLLPRRFLGSLSNTYVKHSKKSLNKLEINKAAYSSSFKRESARVWTCEKTAPLLSSLTQTSFQVLQRNSPGTWNAHQCGLPVPEFQTVWLELVFFPSHLSYIYLLAHLHNLSCITCLCHRLRKLTPGRESNAVYTRVPLAPLAPPPPNPANWNS